MLESIFEFLSCKKCYNKESDFEIKSDINIKKINEEKIGHINENEEIDFDKENQKNMEFIKNVQNVIDEENLKIKEELEDAKNDFKKIFK